ncbi:uncharacterized protein [Onthophagus taurus]|uniref:uncharacterized protein n=1 Tax=Onthophagus taurus TaxID=166361 RepID=UPI000C1FDA4C|nr:uncharacterized protein LOC111422401 [Onthophagus taurus]
MDKMDAPILEPISEEVDSCATPSFKSNISKRNVTNSVREFGVVKNVVMQSQKLECSPQCHNGPTNSSTKYQLSEYDFPKFKHQHLNKEDVQKSKNNKSYSSILNKPFLFRRSESLDKAVTLEEKRLIELYRKNQTVEEYDSSRSHSTRFSTSLSSNTNSSLSSPSISESKSKFGMKDYFKSLSGIIEEQEALEHAVMESVMISDISVQKEKPQCVSLAMVVAQKYLRLHRIFELYQFLIAHLLSALPENPIQFLLDLLDNCLSFRTGLTMPPLLYQKKHLEALFKMMDRMGSGYIDLEQYKAGMKSIGVCMVKEELLENPLIAIDKKTFVDDALIALESILIDILRRKYMKDENVPTTPPPPTPLNRTISSSASVLSCAKSTSTNTKFSVIFKKR